MCGVSCVSLSFQEQQGNLVNFPWVNYIYVIIIENFSRGMKSLSVKFVLTFSYKRQWNFLSYTFSRFDAQGKIIELTGEGRCFCYLSTALTNIATSEINLYHIRLQNGTVPFHIPSIWQINTLSSPTRWCPVSQPYEHTVLRLIFARSSVQITGVTLPRNGTSKTGQQISVTEKHTNYFGSELCFCQMPDNFVQTEVYKSIQYLKMLKPSLI